MFGFGRKSPPARRPSGPRKPVQRNLDVGGRMLPLAVREHPRATRITLRIEPGARSLRLTVPRGLPEDEIETFLVRHHGWLMTRLARFPQDSGISEGSMVALRGIEHRIVRTGRLRGVTETAVVAGEPALLVSGAPEHTPRRVADFLKREARIDLESAVELHAGRLGRPVRSISYKDTRSRWGSCTADGRLSFSWRIVMAPPLVIDYLAAHEVAHLAEMNHGPRFWTVCRMLCPDTEEAKRWLKKNGSRLHAMEF